MTTVLDTAHLAVAALISIGVLATFVDLARGYLSIPLLAELPRVEGRGPRVSVIIAARDEAADIERALRSVLAQAYDDYEVIVVDDRSADGTGAILDRVAAAEPRLRVLRVRELPDGWLGKNHAMARGAEAATGELLLFTDADVEFAPTALARAVRHLTDERADHVTAGPDIRPPTLPLELAVNFFTMAFMIYMKPWKAADPRSPRHLGVGAFNLVRADTYRRIGGHAPIALRPDDDVKLGKLVKDAGGRQRVVAGRDMITLAWYTSLGEFVRGLRKNAFAGLEYSVPRFVAAVSFGLLGNVWPFVAVLVTDGATRALYAAAAVLQMGMYAFSAVMHGSRPWLGLFYPVAALIFLYTVTAASVRVLVRRGIEWRGTFYPLAELRRNRV